MVITNLLAHQLVRPLVDLLSTTALDSGDDERHVVSRFACEGSLEEESSLEGIRGGGYGLWNLVYLDVSVKKGIRRYLCKVMHPCA